MNRSATASLVCLAPCRNLSAVPGSSHSRHLVVLTGYFGLDCALSLDANGQTVILDGQGYEQSRLGPAIYVYELPPHVSTW